MRECLDEGVDGHVVQGTRRLEREATREEGHAQTVQIPAGAGSGPSANWRPRGETYPQSVGTLCH